MDAEAEQAQDADDEDHRGVRAAGELIEAVLPQQRLDGSPPRPRHDMGVLREGVHHLRLVPRHPHRRVLADDRHVRGRRAEFVRHLRLRLFLKVGLHAAKEAVLLEVPRGGLLLRLPHLQADVQQTMGDLRALGVKQGLEHPRPRQHRGLQGREAAVVADRGRGAPAEQQRHRLGGVGLNGQGQRGVIPRRSVDVHGLAAIDAACRPGEHRRNALRPTDAGRRGQERPRPRDVGAALGAG
mmetsp:Transcript_75570/g.211837  ORF Transcript_75570/g.211837 Transcript_75570/m.211837 type:complete len:240 (-) Transcript_75570:19-738(-)